MKREFDLVLFGATGFTGKLVAGIPGERTSQRRSLGDRRPQSRQARGARLRRAGLVADAIDPPPAPTIAKRTKVVCTTVGPYAKYGSELVAACADAGTHYCDLTGEVNWMREMIDAHHERATQTGARIVHACGFDSIPSDLGTWATQQEFIRRFGAPAHDGHRASTASTSGGISGGTAASAFVIAEAMEDPRRCAACCATRTRSIRIREAPHPPRRRQARVGWDATLKMFYVPFFMAATNSPVVRRGHALAGYPWGEDFVYREVMATPGNARGARDGRDDHRRARRARGRDEAAAPARACCRSVRRSRARDRRGEARERGHWKVRFVAESGDDSSSTSPPIRPAIRATRRPRRCSASPRCASRTTRSTSPGGVLTPSVAMEASCRAAARAAFAPALTGSAPRCYEIEPWRTGSSRGSCGSSRACSFARSRSSASSTCRDRAGAVRRQSSELADRSDPHHHDVRPQGALRREGHAVQGPADARGAARPRRGADQAARRSRRRRRAPATEPGERPSTTTPRSPRCSPCSARAARSASSPRASRTTSRSSRGSRPARRGSRSAARTRTRQPIPIVPCGLTFIHPKRFRSRVLVQFGPPIVGRAARPNTPDEVRSVTDRDRRRAAPADDQRARLGHRARARRRAPPVSAAGDLDRGSRRARAPVQRVLRRGRSGSARRRR